MLDMSRGSIQIGMGLWCLVWGVVLVQPWVHLDEDMNAIGWGIGMSIAVVLTQRGVQYARKRKGIPQVEIRRSAARAPRIIAWTLAGLLAGLASVALAGWLPNQGVAIFGAAALILAVPMGWRAYQLKLWEHWLQSAGLLVVFGLMFLGDRPIQMAGLCATLSLVELIAGLSLHRRWKRWVAALPPDAGADGAAHATDAEAPR
ncbi:MAG: hypothetical protein ACREJ2_13025 [Planctomycetota bacterium]